MDKRDNLKVMRRLGGLLALSLIAFSLSVEAFDASDLEDSEQQYYEPEKIITNAYEAGKYDEVIDECTASLNYAEEAPIYHVRGLAYLAKKQYDLALSDFRAAVEINPQSPVYVGDLATTYLRKDYLGQAITYSQKAISMDPKNKTAYLRLGDCYYKKKEWDSATQSYQRAIEVDPGYAEGYEALGNVSMEKGDVDQAIRSYSKGLEVSPQGPVASRIAAARKKAFSKKFSPAKKKR